MVSYACDFFTTVTSSSFEIPTSKENTLAMEIITTSGIPFQLSNNDAAMILCVCIANCVHTTYNITLKDKNSAGGWHSESNFFNVMSIS